MNGKPNRHCERRTSWGEMGFEIEDECLNPYNAPGLLLPCSLHRH